MNVGLAITRNRVRWPDADALFGGAGLTNLDLDRRTNQIARALVEHFGLVKGDRVALLVANRPEVVEVLGGVAKAGLVYVGLNFRLGPVELEQVLENAEPGMVLTDAEHRDQVSDVVDTYRAPVLDIDGTEWLDLVAAASDSPPPSLYDTRADDDFCIVYTSGTTGRPKGILFDHARALQHATVACLEYQIGHDSRYLIQIPHNSSVNITIVPCLVVGAAMGFRDSRSFDPIGFARSVEQDGVTHSFLVPTQLMRLLDRLPTTSDHQLGGLVTLGYGASPISPERLSQLVGRFGPIFNQLYGMAEIASIGNHPPQGRTMSPGWMADPSFFRHAASPRMPSRSGSSTRTETTSAVGNRGEVVFAGPHIMKRYFRDPDRTDEVLIDGWMHSGDVAEVSDDGYIFIVDRIKNLIIRGGLNIAPTEIENVLYRHPAVLEAAVVGIPDPEWGEAILAVVALKEGAEAGPEELRLHCRTSELTSIKVPERVEIVDSLPKNAVGKIAKNEIRDRFLGRGTEGLMAQPPHAAIAGIGVTRQARQLETSTIEACLEATSSALDDAGMTLDDIDGLAARWPGPGGTVFQPGSVDWTALFGRPFRWVCDTYPQGVPGVLDATAAIATGLCDNVLVVGGQAGVLGGTSVASYTRPDNGIRRLLGSADRGSLRPGRPGVPPSTSPGPHRPGPDRCDHPKRRFGQPRRRDGRTGPVQRLGHPRLALHRRALPAPRPLPGVGRGCGGDRHVSRSGSRLPIGRRLSSWAEPASGSAAVRGPASLRRGVDHRGRRLRADVLGRRADAVRRRRLRVVRHQHLRDRPPVRDPRSV